MIYGRFAKEKQDLETANEIIRQVFEEELGLSANEEEESFVLTALLFDSAEESALVVGAGRLLFDERCPEIAEIAVLPEHRGLGYGELLARILVDKALTANAQSVLVHALSGTEGFFGRIGFQTEGEGYSAYGGRWQCMVLSGEAIRSCATCASSDGGRPAT